MKIEHIALWTADLERSKAFYETFFGARAGEKYVNPKTGFSSYFLSLENGPRLEIMASEFLRPPPSCPGDRPGLAHFALSVGTKAAVDRLTAELSEQGVTVVSKPRRTGDGYYESTVKDPDGNLIEIVA